MDTLETTKRIDEVAATLAQLLQPHHCNIDKLHKEDRTYASKLLHELEDEAPHVLDSHSYVFAQAVRNNLSDPKPAVEHIAAKIARLRQE